MTTTPSRPATDPGARATLVSELSTLPRHDLPVLEAYRGVAALMVVLTHVGFISSAGIRGAWAGWLSRLDFGVALFFLLSGFLLFRPYVQAAYGRRPPVRLGAYLRRRYIRIYPAFVTVLVVDYLITPAARQASGSVWFQTVFMLQNYTVNFVHQLPGMVQCWSLAVEVSFYLALPLLAALILGPSTSAARASDRLGRLRAEAGDEAGPVARRGRPVPRLPLPRRLLAGLNDPLWRRQLAALRPGIMLAGFAVFTIVWRAYYTNRAGGLGNQVLWLPAFLDWFGAGMLLAWLSERAESVPPVLRYIAAAPGACWSLALAGYWLTTTELAGPFGLEGPTNPQALFKHLSFLVIATLLLLPAVFGDPAASWRRTATSPFFRWLGQISFGVFLWHPMLLDAIRSMLGRQPFDGGFWISLIFTLAASMIVATASWKYLEEPLQRRWRNGFWTRPQP